MANAAGAARVCARVCVCVCMYAAAAAVTNPALLLRKRVDEHGEHVGRAVVEHGRGRIRHGRVVQPVAERHVTAREVAEVRAI